MHQGEYVKNWIKIVRLLDNLLVKEREASEAAEVAIEDAFNEDLNQLRLYRECNAPGVETYICTIYDDMLLIFEDTGKQWTLQDISYRIWDIRWTGL